MESYQPWPIFNVQNELAGVQKKGELQFKSGEWYKAIFFSVSDWAAHQPPCNLPPPYHPPCFQLSYYTGFIFLSKEGQAWRGNSR